MERPDVSVVVPSLNQGMFLEECLVSIERQKGIGLEIIVMDAGSKDESVEVIANHERSLAYWQSEPDGGQAAAINSGWDRARGEWITWLNSDDFYLGSDALKTLVELGCREDSSVVAGRCEIVDRTGEVLGEKEARGVGTVESLSWGRSLPQPSTIVRRRLIKEIGLLREDLDYAFDWEFFLRAMLSVGSEQFGFSDVVVAASREYPETKTQSGLSMKARERREAVRDLRGLIRGGPKERLRFLRRGIAGSYRVEGIDYARQGRLARASVAFLAMGLLEPVDVLMFLPRLPWLLRQMRS